MTPLSLLAAPLFALLPALALAHGDNNGQPGANFIAQWDISGSGAVSLADMQTKRGDLFDMFDLSGDGVIDALEAQNMADTVAAQEASKGQEPRGKGQGAQASGKGPGRLIHAAMTLPYNDANSDGEITRDEFLAASVQLFAALDRNQDGSLTLADMGR
jgi:Ca2+-binding EF-hand superfamily protein